MEELKQLKSDSIRISSPCVEEHGSPVVMGASVDVCVLRFSRPHVSIFLASDIKSDLVVDVAASQLLQQLFKLSARCRTPSTTFPSSRIYRPSHRFEISFSSRYYAPLRPPERSLRTSTC